MKYSWRVEWSLGILYTKDESFRFFSLSLLMELNKETEEVVNFINKIKKILIKSNKNTYVIMAYSIIVCCLFSEQYNFWYEYWTGFPINSCHSHRTVNSSFCLSHSHKTTTTICNPIIADRPIIVSYFYSQFTQLSIIVLFYIQWVLFFFLIQ